MSDGHMTMKFVSMSRMKKKRAIVLMSDDRVVMKHVLMSMVI